jgi:hypothetical protein
MYVCTSCADLRAMKGFSVDRNRGQRFNLSDGGRISEGLFTRTIKGRAKRHRATKVRANPDGVAWCGATRRDTARHESHCSCEQTFSGVYTDIPKRIRLKNGRSVRNVPIFFDGRKKRTIFCCLCKRGFKEWSYAV